MITIDQLYDLIYKDESTKEPAVFLKVIEPYKFFLSNFEFSNYDERYKVTRLISDIAIMKCTVGETRYALPYLYKAVSLFEEDEKLLNKDLLDETLYAALIHKRGEALFKMKKYNAALKDFKRLKEKFPESRNIREWYNQCKQSRLNYLEWFLLALFFMIVVITYFFDVHSVLLIFVKFALLIGFLVTFLHKKNIK